MLLRGSLAAACAVACLLTPGAAQGASPPPPTPEPIAAKRLSCEPGQVDINSATVSQISSRLGLSLPVAQRVVAHRQPLYLDLEDLLAVEGVGAGKLARIQRAGIACTDLPVTPPPTDQFVCRPNDGRIDLNRPTSRARLVTMFGAPTADRIVAGIPYSGVKSVVSEHVPGVGQGKQAKLLDQLCATPPTIDHKDTRWGWISTAGGRVDHPKGATLTAGAGVIDNPAGMWGSVTKMPFDKLDGGPKFDLKVHGPWQAGGSVVYGTLPPDPFQPPSHASEWKPTLLHGSGLAADVHAYDAVYVGSDGRWTAQLRSLSLLQSIFQPGVSLRPLLTDSVQSLIELGRGVAKDILVGGFEGPRCSPNASGIQRLRVSVEPPALATGALGGFIRPGARWCAEGDAAASSVTFKLSNTGMPTFDYQEWQGPADTTGVYVSPDLSVLTRELLEFYNRGVKPGPDSSGVVYGPGVTVLFKLPASEQEQQVDLTRASAQTAARDVLFIMTQHLGQIPGLEAPGRVLACVKLVESGTAGFSDFVACIAAAAREVAEGTKAQLWLQAMSRALTAISLLRSGAEYLALIGLSSQGTLDGEVTFKLLPDYAPAPGQPTSGDPGQPGARILKRSGSTASYVLDANGVAHHIPDGGTYICNAKHLMVQYNVDEKEWAAQVKSVGAEATCPSGGGRVLGPKAVPAGVLIRREDGKTYLTETFDGISYLVPLFSGSTVFNCMVEKYLVWDWVTFEEYDRFHHHPNLVATGCGVSI